LVLFLVKNYDKFKVDFPAFAPNTNIYITGEESKFYVLTVMDI